MSVTTIELVTVPASVVTELAAELRESHALIKKLAQKVETGPQRDDHIPITEAARMMNYDLRTFRELALVPVYAPPGKAGNARYERVSVKALLAHLQKNTSLPASRD